MADPLPTKLNEHTWATIKNTAGTTHHLIPLGFMHAIAELLDWVEQSGHFDVWISNPSAGPTADPFDATAWTTGSWASILSGHDLVYLSNEPGSFTFGNVLDWQPGTMGARIWKFDRTINPGDPMPTLLNQSSFATIGSGHTLIYLDHDRVMDWEPASGHTRVWQYDRTRTNLDPLPTLITENTFATIRTGHQLVYLGGDLLLDWEEPTGVVRVWRYDRSLSGNVDPFPDKEMEHNWSGKISVGRKLSYLGNDRVLDWDPQTGHERIWDFDRPMMPATKFQTMLNSDIATALSWVGAAQGALTLYQAGLLSGIHDFQWNVTDFALSSQFHVQTHPNGVQAALSTIMSTYALIFTHLTTQAATISQVSKSQALTDLGGLPNYTRGYSVMNNFTRLTPCYRPFDTIGRHRVDGAGNKLRAAIQIHEATHFVGNNPDSAAEWETTYDTLTSPQAITNPSSYGVFAHQILTGEDLRFGNFPWQ